MSDQFRFKSEKMPGDWLFKVVPWIIGGGFVLVVVSWLAIAVIAAKVVSDPKAVALQIGAIAGAARDGFNDPPKAVSP